MWCIDFSGSCTEMKDYIEYYVVLHLFLHLLLAHFYVMVIFICCRFHMSPLMYAAREGRVKVVKRLIELQVDIDKQDTRGYTVGGATMLVVARSLNLRSDK